MGVGVEGAAKSLHLPRLHAIQVTPAGVSVEGDFVLGWRLSTAIQIKTVIATKTGTLTRYRPK